ncbi:MAG: hypothetical protein Roseis2KO_28310 [Roseivirga sp.]
MVLMVSINIYSRISITLIAVLSFTSCDDRSSSLDGVILDLGFKGIEAIYDYTTCLEDEIVKYPNSYKQLYVASNPWLVEDQVVMIAAFNEELTELSFVQNQTAVEASKRIITHQDVSILERNFRRNVLQFLMDEGVKIQGERINSLDLNQMQQMYYTLRAHNSGLLKKSAAFSIESDKVKYEFVLVSQFDEELGDTIGDYHKTLWVSANTDTLTLDKTLFEQSGKLNYYLIPIENPCTIDQKIHQPIVVGEGIKVHYRYFD